MVVITGVSAGSAAEKVGLLAGDELMAVNGHEICDVLDYRFRIYERRLKLEVMRGGKRVVFRIRKPPSVGVEVTEHWVFQAAKLI